MSKVKGQMSNVYPQGGYIAFVTLIIVAAVTLAAALSASVLSIGEAQSGLASSKGYGNLDFVEGCAEDAILKVDNSPTYAGGNITRPEGTCSVIASKAGSIWTLTVTTTATDYKRTVQIVLNRSSHITITSWKEL